MQLTFSHTRKASYIGYVTQAIIVNLAPLLFVTLRNQFGISLGEIGMLVSINFAIQMLVDLAAIRFVDRIGYRVSAVAAHAAATIGLVLMGILPNVMQNAYAGLLIAIAFNSIGGGLIEVLVSPIVEALPGDKKAASMSFLHAFYSWGHVLVVLLSTLYFVLFGVTNWMYLPILWALVPFLNIFLFARVPIRTLTEGSQPLSLKKLFSARIFWLLILLMICSGASEQAMVQWSSLFAELGLGVSKTMGDLLGPCAFAVLMGLNRMYGGMRGDKLRVTRALIASAIGCFLSYMVAVFAPVPVISLIGCALCGLCVGTMWPGVLSLSAERYPQGGTGMFAILALSGDIGCAVGPGIVGFVSDGAQHLSAGIVSFLGQATLLEAGLKVGLLVASVFPVVLLIGVLTMSRKKAVKAV